jgi:transcriptional regulator with XRE-family HTH domain
MKILSENSDQVVLGELGARLARIRLESNITQAQLAAEAGVSKATVERIENGRDAKLSNLVRVLRALDLLDALDRLVPEPLPNPIERSRRQGRRRRRAGRRQDGGESARPWQWDDPPPEQEPPGR